MEGYALVIPLDAVVGRQHTARLFFAPLSREHNNVW